MIGFIDPKNTIDKVKKLLDKFGTNLSTDVELNINQSYNNNMTRVDIVIHIKVPNIKQFNEKLVEILEGE